MIVDLFAGPGGWDLGLASAGLRALGVEIDAAAAATRAAAGLLTLRQDATTLDPARFAPLDGLIASPPCPDFSAAGLRAGIGGDSGRLMWEVPRWVEQARPRWVACEQVPPALEWWEAFAADFRAWGYRTWTGVLNAADFGVPQTRRRAFLLASLDRQPHPPEPTHARDPAPVLFGAELEPWVSMAEALGWGMTARPGLTFTGSADGGRSDGTGGAGSREAIHREQREGRRVGFPRRDDTGTSDDGYRDRDWRDADEPSHSLTGRSLTGMVVSTGMNSMKHTRDPQDMEPFTRPVEEPAPTLDAQAGSKWQVGPDGHRRPPHRWKDDEADELVVNTGRDWKEGGTRDDAQKIPLTEPAPNIDGKGRWRVERRADAPTLGDEHTDWAWERRLGIEDALVLQSFPPDYPVQGTKTKQFEQVGNAVCPRLAAAILRALTDKETP